MKFNSILHIGAGKCGSTSLQSSLSHGSKELYSSENIRFEYVAIRDKGEVYRSSEIRRYLKKTAYPSINSFDITSDSIDNAGITQVASQLKAISEQDICPIMSCEGWASKASIFRDQQLLGKLNLQPSLIMFVRPPLDWINSAWWQWGAWQNIDIDSWLKRQMQVVNWTRWIKEWKQLPEVQQLNVRVVAGNVVSSFADTYKLELEPQKNTNVSSSPTLLRFLQRNRQYRSGPHDNFMEKQLVKEIPEDSANPPWILSEQQQLDILESLRRPYQEMLDFLHPVDREIVRADPRWWDTAAYGERNIESPGSIETQNPEMDRYLEKCILRIQRRATFRKVIYLPSRLKARLTTFNGFEWP